MGRDWIHWSLAPSPIVTTSSIEKLLRAANARTTSLQDQSKCAEMNLERYALFGFH